MDKPEIMTIEEVSEYLRVSERTVYDWAQKGEIPCGKLGTSWRFKRSEIEKWIDGKLGTQDRRSAEQTLAIREVLTPSRVAILDCAHKTEALDALIELIATAPQVQNKEELAREVSRREGLMSTGIGSGIAVPHVRLASVQNIVMAVGVSKQNITDYESLDGKPVRIILLVAAGRDQHAQYLKTLASVSSRLKEEKFRDAVLDADNTERIYDLLIGNE